MEAAGKPKYQLFPNLGADEMRKLEESILLHGVQHPISVDDTGAVLDGHHRLAICEKNKLVCPRVVMDKLTTEDDKVKFVLTMNLARRNLTPTEKAEFWGKLRLLGMSLAQIAEQTGAPKSSVGWALKRLADDRAAKGLPPLTEIVVGKDGKARMASAPVAPKPVAAPAVPAVIPEGAVKAGGFIHNPAGNSVSMGDSQPKRDPVAAGIVPPIPALAPPTALFGTILANYTEEQVFELFCLLDDHVSSMKVGKSDNPVETEEEGEE